MEVKWIVTAWAVIMVGMALGGAYESKVKADCRIAYSQSTKTGEEINAICNK